jgi:4-amino-4-deoxy-L-arabinose transferase-like glycosyltransferase
LTPDRRILLSLFAIAFGLRILYAATVGSAGDIAPDPRTYDFRTAESIHSSFEWVSEPFTPKAPGYILALAALMRVFGPSVWVALLFNAFLGAATTFFMYRIGERKLGPGVGLLAAIWLGLYLHHIHSAAVISRDVLVVFLWMWILHVSTQYMHNFRSAAWMGLLYTVLIHVEPMFVVLLPVFVIGFALFTRRNRSLGVQSALLFAATVCVLCVPWMVRNYVVYKEPIPISLEATRYTGPLGRMFDTSVVDPAEVAPATEQTLGSPGFVHNSVEFWRVVRLSDAAGNPYLRIPPEPAWSTRHNVINLLSFGVLLPFLIAGCAIGRRRHNLSALALMGGMTAWWIVRGFAGANERSRLPVEPIVILLAIYGAMQLLTRFRRNARNSASSETTPPG